MKKYLFLAALISASLLTFPADAAKISGFQEFGLTGGFYIGVVTGPGIGLNFGLDAGVPFESFTFGVEVEQLVTDADLDTNINATKFGGIIRYQVIEDFISIGAHAGVLGYMTSKDTSYHDTFSGKKIEIKGEEKNSGSYVAGSIDFKFGALILTPKVSLLNIGKGYLPEIDLNVGARF